MTHTTPEQPEAHLQRTAFVTGGGTGIGEATARRLVREGWRVAITGRRPDQLDRVAAETGALPIPADLAEPRAAAAAVNRAAEELGRLDAVVANAGGHGFATVEDTDDAQWAESWSGNVTTAFHTARAAVPHLRGTRGSVVVVSSLAGLRAGPAVAGYTVGKHALLGLTRSLARDFGPEGIRANTVCPGWVRTPMADGEMDEFVAAAPDVADRDGAYARVTRHVPLRRPADPDEIAAVIAFLAGPGASYITGATLVADGGAHVVDLPTLDFDVLG